MEKIGLAAVLDMSDFDSNMAKYDASLEKMNQTTADAAGKVGQQFVGLGDAVNKAALVVATAFVAATAAAGAALAKFTGDGIEKAADLEKQMGGIAAVMSTTKDAVGPLKDLIQDLALDPRLKVNTTEAADAIEMLGRNGLTMSQILDGAAESTVLLANATEADFGTAADIATDVMSLFNIEAADMNTAVDGITSVVNNSKFSIDDYRLAIAQGGGVAASVGVEFDDFNTTIAATAPLFGSGSDAGTSFKTFLQRLVPDTDKAAGAMVDLGLFTGMTRDQFQKAEEQIAKYEGEMAKIDPTSRNAAAKQAELAAQIDVLKSSLQTGQNAFFHVDGSMRSMEEIAGLLQDAMSGLSEEQKIQAASTIFGTDAMRTAVGLASVGNEQFLALKTTMGNTSAEEAAATRMDNFSGTMEILQGVIEAVQIKIGERFLPTLRTLAERLTALVTENEEKLLAFFGGVAGWVGEKIPLAMDWLVQTGLPAMAQAFNYLTDTVFPGIAKAIAWATENWDFLSGAIKVLAGVLVTASLVSTFAGIVTAITPLITLISGAGGVVAAIAGGGGLVATLLGLLNPIGLVVAAVGGLALAWIALSGDTDESAVAMRESAERETRQMATVTGETFKGWADSVAGYHRKMKDESGLTLDEMIDNINADFWQMRQDVEASSGEMSESAIAEMNRMRLEAIKQASEMKTGVSGEVDTMATVSAATSAEFVDQLLSDAQRTKDGAVGDMAAMNTAITSELVELADAGMLSSGEMRAGILAELNTLRVQHADGTTTWTEGAREKIRWMTVEAIQDADRMKQGIASESELLKVAATQKTGEMADSVVAKYRDMKMAVNGELVAMQQNTTTHLDVAKSSWNVAWDSIKNTVNSKAYDIAAAARSAGSGAVDTLRSGWESGTGMFARAVQSVAGSISGYFEERNNHWLTAGRNVIEGVSTGISNRAGGLYAQMQSVANSVLGTFKSALGIRSPSEVFAEAGYNISAGLAQGITEGQSLVSEAMARLQNQTQLELNQYSAMVDNQLAATIARYQQGLAQGQAQDSIRQGFDQGQYAAYWAAIQAGESEASAIAKGQAVARSANGGGAATPGAATPAPAPAQTYNPGTLPSQYQGLQEQIFEETFGFIRDLGIERSAFQQMFGNIAYASLGATSGENVDVQSKTLATLEKVRDVLSGQLSAERALAQIPELQDTLQWLNQINRNGQIGAGAAALPVELRIKIGEFIDQLGAAQIELQTGVQNQIATSSLGALLGKFGGQRQLSADEIAARKAVAMSDIQPNMIALDAAIENLKSQMQELDNAYDMERNRLLSQQLSPEAVTAALNQWLQANGNQQQSIAAFSQLRDAQNQRGQLDSLLAERMAQIDAESVTMATPDVSSITTILQNFAASTLGTKVTDFMADLGNKFSNLYGGISQRLGNAEYFGIDTGGLQQSAIVEAAKTLFSAGGETIFSTIDSALSTLLNYRNVAAAASLENTDNRTDGGWGAPQLTSAISDIASALRQMQTGTTFNVAFQGSAGANADVLSDIQFLNSLYATP